MACELHSITARSLQNISVMDKSHQMSARLISIQLQSLMTSFVWQRLMNSMMCRVLS